MNVKKVELNGKITPSFVESVDDFKFILTTEKNNPNEIVGIIYKNYDQEIWVYNGLNGECITKKFTSMFNILEKYDILIEL